MVPQGMAICRWAQCLALAGVMAAAAMAAGSVLAQPAAAVQAESQAAPVLTRARVVSVEQAPGSQLYVRLKLLPRAKLPFTTQRFRVIDRALLAGIPEGAWVKFSARHVDGENTLTAIHMVEECQRFQHCD